MEFEKWQALGNDYLILEESQLPFPLTPDRIRRLCAAHTGIGSDGILLLTVTATAGSRHSSGPVAQMRIFNPDGSESNLSGNGAREAVMYLRRHWVGEDRFSLTTGAGEIHAAVTSADSCTIDMGHARLRSEDYPDGAEGGRGHLSAAGHEWDFQHVNVGNPQCAIEVASVHELAALDLATLGPGIEHHPLFPNRTNVSWYVGLAPNRIRARIFERGVGETMASGTGATGAAVAHTLRGGASPVTVVLDGGELQVDVREDLSIRLTGWARPVMRGSVAPELMEELRASE